METLLSGRIIQVGTNQKPFSRVFADGHNIESAVWMVSYFDLSSPMISVNFVHGR